MMATEPVFDPNQPFEEVTPKPAQKAAAPVFDPSQPYEEITPKPAERSVLRRAVEAPIESLKESWEGIKKPFIPPKTKQEAKERSGILSSAGETGGAILSAAGAIPGAILSPAQSLISSGMAAITPGEKTSEEKYQEWMPKVGTAFMGLGRAPGVTATPRGSLLPDVILPKTKKVPAKGPEAEAGRFIEEKATDPDAVRRALASPDQEIVPGSKPTTFQLTGDPGLGQLERGAARRPDMVEEFKQRQSEQNRARSQAFEDIEGQGSPAAVSQHLRDEINRTNAADERVIRAAEQQAFEAEQRLGPAYDATVMGERMRREIEIAEAAARERERGVWARVDPDGTLVADPAAIQRLERSIYSPARMTETARLGVTPAENRLSQLIQNYGNYIPFRELTDLRSLISATMREERMARGATPTFQRLLQLRQGVEDALVTSVADVQPAGVARGAGAIGAAERVQAASAATRERAERFNPLRNITRSEAGEAYKLGPSSVSGKIVQPGAKGYDATSNYLRAVGNETGMSTVQDELIRRLRAEVFDRTSTPKQAENRLEGFFRRYGDTLRAIDERDGGAFSQQLRSAGGAQEAVGAATARQQATQARQATDAFKQLTGLVDDGDVARAIGNIMGRVDAQSRARELMSRLRGNPAAEEGARRAIVAHMRDRLTSDVLSTDTPAMRAQAFQKYVRFNRQALSEILTPQQVTTLETIAADLLRETRTNQTKAVGGGSDTVQNWLAEQQQQGAFRQAAGRIFTPLVRRVLAHWAAATLGGPAASVGLAATEGAIEAGKLAKAVRRTERIKLIQGMVDEAMLKPEKAKEYLGKTHRYKAKTPGAKAITGYEAGAAEKERQSLSRAEGGTVREAGGAGGRSGGARTAPAARQARPGASKAVSDGRAARQQEADPWGFGEIAKNDPHGLLTAPPQYEPGAQPYEPRAPGGTFYREDLDRPTERLVPQAADRGFVITPTPGWRMPPPREDVVYADGGEVKQSGGSRERFAAALAGTPGGGFETKGKFAAPPSRQDIIDTLRRHGISGGAWADSRTNVDSRADGGDVGDIPALPPAPPPPTPTPPPDLTENPDEIPGTGFEDESSIDPNAERRKQLPFTPYQEGGAVEDEKLPTPGGESRALERQPAPLPVMRTNRAGETLPEYILKAWGKGAADWAMTPGRAYREGLTPEEEASWGARTAMGMMGSGVPMATPGSAGIFGGRLATTANLPMLEKAEMMHALGEPAHSIWNQTGWFRGADGKWRFEISDQPAKLMPLDEKQLAKSRAVFPTGQAGGGPSITTERFGLLPDVVHHPEYFKAYPQMETAGAEVFIDPRHPGNEGFYSRPDPTGHPSTGGLRPAFLHATGNEADRALSSLLHEMQHGVQNIEGFTPGSNPTMAAKLIGPTRQRALAAEVARQRGLTYSQLDPFEQKKLRDRAAVLAYGKVAGEVEPRNVQHRWEKGIVQRPPFLTESIPREFQLVPTGQKRTPFLPGEPYADGGGVEEDDKLPTPGGGLSRTAGPTVTSTTREEDIPPPATNRAGETLPTYILKSWARNLIPGITSFPERYTKFSEAATEGDPQRATGRENFELFGYMGGRPSPGAGTVLGAGMARPRAAPRGAELTPRRASPAEITRAAKETESMTQPELRKLYADLGLTGTPPSELAAPSLRARQPQSAIDEATQLKMADRELLNRITDAEERKLVKEGAHPSIMLPSSEAQLPAQRAFEPIKKEVTRAEEAFDKLAAEGRAPSLWDISTKTLMRRPQVEQFPLPRYRAEVTERLKPAFEGGAGLERIERAQGLAGPRGLVWYNIQEPLQDFTRILGPIRGPMAADAWLDALAGTSMVNPIESNIRGSSHYLQRILAGEPMPQLIKMKDPYTGQTVIAMAGGPPVGYGAKAQQHHAARVQQFLEHQGDPVANPKPMSYRQNLGGNYLPRTVDTHDIRNMLGMPYAKQQFGESGGLLPREYAALEGLGGEASRRLGKPQAMQQAGTWIGGGPYTQLKSQPVPLIEALNRRVHVTSMVTGKTPAQVWSDHVTGRVPLFARGGFVGAGYV